MRVRRRLVPVVIALGGAGLLAGCAGAPASPPASTAATAVMGPTVPAASATAVGLRRVDVAGFAQAVATPGVVVLDVRTPVEYAAGHLPNAVNIDVESGDFAARVGDLDRATTYAVYCRSGNRSRVATEAMQQLGFTSLYDLDGGINDWKAAGRPVAT